jgi:nicotinamide mononucleotide transporter
MPEPTSFNILLSIILMVPTIIFGTGYLFHRVGPGSTVDRRGYVKPWEKFVDSLGIGVLATVVSYITAIGLSLTTLEALDPLELFAVFTSYSCTYLCVVQSRWNYPIGVVTTVAYSWLFWNYGLLASSVLNSVLAVNLIYGWFRWRSDANTRPVTRLGWSPVWFGYAAIVAAGYFILTSIGYTVADYTGTDFPFVWTDSVILIGTLFAQLLLDNKRLETWAVWVLVNVFSIYTYYNAELYIVVIQYVLFLANTIYGWYEWRKSMKKTEALIPIVQEF